MSTETAASSVDSGEGSAEGTRSAGAAPDADEPAEPPSYAPLRVIDRSPSGTTWDCAWFERNLSTAAQHLERPINDVTVVVVNDDTMSALHDSHLRDHRTTDVLTFNLAEPDAESIDAEIIVCIDEARRNASRRDLPVERELLLYALHGLLHCCGFDDGTDEQFSRMHAEEDRILAAIGVGVTFADSPAQRGAKP